MMIRNLIGDSRHAVRSLVKRPGFLVVAVTTLALGIGANTAIFTVLNSVVLTPLPYPQPDRLVRIYNAWEDQPDMGGFLSGFDFPYFRDGVEGFESAGVLYTYRETGRDLTGSDMAQRVRTLPVSDGYFDTYRATPLLGRTLTREEETGDARVVVLSHRLWKAYTGADPDVLGTTIELDGVAHTVVGVMRAGFLDVIGGDVDLWVPQNLEPGGWNNRGNHYLTGIARLRPGVTLAQAQAQVDAVQRGLAAEFPDSYEEQLVRLVPLHEDVVGTSRTVLFVLMAAAGLVLLIACVNVANLFLARSVSRTKEIAVRTALGSGRGRVVGQSMTESLIVAAVGAVAGSIVAFWGVKALLAISPESLARAEEVSFDPTLLGFGLLITLLTALAFGSAPALRIARIDPHESLRDGGRGNTGGRRKRRTRSALVASQVALAMVLLIGAGLLIRSFIGLSRVDLGFDPRNVATFEVHLPSSRYPDGEDRIRFHRQLIQRLDLLPGVVAAGAASWLPANGAYHDWGFGYLTDAGERDWLSAQVRVVEGDYFEALGIELLRGRTFDSSDRLDAEPVALINESLAQQAYRDSEPVGQRFLTGAGEFTIIGVVNDVAHEARGEFARRIYLTHSQYGPNRNWAMTYAVKTREASTQLFELARRQLTALDASLVLFHPRTMTDVLGRQTARDRFAMTLLVLFAGLALALAAVGIYGVLSYSVNQRLHEIGIRMALGARASQVWRGVVGHAALVAGIGMAVGLLGAVAASRFLGAMVYGVSVTDPVVFLVVVLVIAAVTLGSGLLPAWRASRVDPMVTLRRE
jgi:putative ABC transport system permease protein